MKVTEKKLDDGRILLEAVASTAEVSHALTAAQYRFAQQMGVQPTPVSYTHLTLPTIRLV